MYKLARSVLFKMEAERAHHLTLRTLAALPSLPRLMTPTVKAPASLAQTIWGFTFPHPIGLAAGLDKNGVAIRGLQNCGFAFIEVGTVTPRPQPGNPLPRLFRLTQDTALINRMGFNNEGADAVYARVQARARAGVVGVNLGKNKLTDNAQALDDYLLGVGRFHNVADYLVINISSPNTPGLRDLQDEDALIPLVEGVLAHRQALQAADGHVPPRPMPPVLLKIAPDLTDAAIDSLGRKLMKIGIDGFIATNTTTLRPSLKSPLQRETGGLSGRPLAARSTEVIRILYRATEGRLPIIGSGGILSAHDAYEKIRAGASLIQLYTGFIYEGPALVQRIIQGLAQFVAADGFASIRDAVGTDAGRVDSLG